MSKGKLDEIVRKLREKASWNDLCKLAPFLSKDTLAEMVDAAMNESVSAGTINRLAPFLPSGTLFKLIVKNSDRIDWATLRHLIPFLKRDMVDQLATMMHVGKPNTVMTTLGDALQNAVKDISGIGAEIGSTIGSIFAPASGNVEKKSEEAPAAEKPVKAEAVQTEAPKTPKAPSEFKDKVARAALKAGNWAWLEAHLYEIGDRSLVTEVAVTAVKQNDEKLLGIPQQAAKVMDIAQIKDLFDAIVESEAWNAAISLKDFADEYHASAIVERAGAATGERRESAYAVVEVFACKANRDLLERITEKAIAEDNWALINAMTEGF